MQATRFRLEDEQEQDEDGRKIEASLLGMSCEV